MPESFVVAYHCREILHKADLYGDTSHLPPEHVFEHGVLEFYDACHARAKAGQPHSMTVSLHSCRVRDPLFLSPPGWVSNRSPSTACAACKPTEGRLRVVPTTQVLPSLAVGDISTPAKYANALHIRGRLYSVCRGKELVIIIGQFVIRVSFAQEGHCLWIPTPMFNDIIAGGTVPRGQTSHAFRVPQRYLGATHTCDLPISIQAAFRRPDWTLIFVDHNSMMTFHVMVLREVLSSPLSPAHSLWPYVWSSTHGPTFPLEPSAAATVLQDWRRALRARATTPTIPIFIAIITNQSVFNGYGAQETCDMLWAARIHPRQPAIDVCEEPTLWMRFWKAVSTYQGMLSRRLVPVFEIHQPLPSRHCSRLAQQTQQQASFTHTVGSVWTHVSSPMPWRFNLDGHNRFLAGVTTYRRLETAVTIAEFDELVELHLLDPFAVLQCNGTGHTLHTDDRFYATVPVAAVPRPAYEKVCLRIYEHGILHAGNIVHAYTPILARPRRKWVSYYHISRVMTDLRDAVNLTTLGPYSFRIFVDCAYTPKRVKGCIFRGRRQAVAVATGRRKRPKVSTLKLMPTHFVRPEPITRLLVKELQRKDKERRQKRADAKQARSGKLSALGGVQVQNKVAKKGRASITEKITSWFTRL